VGDEDLHAQVVCVLDGGKTMVGSSRENPCAVGLQAVYTLNAAADPLHGARHLIEVAPRGPRGGDMFCTSTRWPPHQRAGGDVLRARASGRHGRVVVPELGHRSAMATVVSLARKRSCR